MAEEVNNVITKRVCVTGAGGYIGSWLVKNLLQKGYRVHATLRNPGDETKSRPLLDLPGSQERLKLFRADLLEEGSFDSAVDGCEGVFHVAGPIGYVQNSVDDFVKPAIKGLLNILKASTKSKSVKRVVFTSSVTAASPLNDKGEFAHSCLDESCWSPLDFLKREKSKLASKLAWYMIAKTIAEQEALKYATENELEVVIIAPGMVVGPWFTVTPALTSAQTLLSLIGGNDTYYGMIKHMESVLGSIPIVHIDDVCNAHIFLMEHPRAEGRYICSADSLSLRSLKEFVYKRYEQFKESIKLNGEDYFDIFVPTSSRKLLEMGFSYRYNLEETFDEGIQCALKCGIL